MTDNYNENWISITEAAEHLYMHQSSISRSISALEDELGKKLGSFGYSVKKPAPSKVRNA